MSTATSAAAAPPRLRAATLRLINRFQHDVPITAAPFAAMAEALDADPQWLLQELQRLQQQGVLSRVGPTFEHRRAGASTLAALAVPPARLQEVAAQVNRWREVNHNYEREHHWNLWFVVTAPDAAGVARVLAGIARDSGLQPISLPMLRPFHIDLGFALIALPGGRVGVDLQSPRPSPAPVATAHDAATVLPPAAQVELRRQLERGLPLTPRPYLELARTSGCSEAQALAQCRAWQAAGWFRRHGLVLRHHALGIRANLMLVLDVADDEVDAVGERLGAAPGVSLCYRRRRQLPQWRYNLFCMIHGHDRAAVAAHAAWLLAEHGLARAPHQHLFSLRAFKQRGGRYVAATPEPAHG